MQMVEREEQVLREIIQGLVVLEVQRKLQVYMILK